MAWRRDYAHCVSSISGIGPKLKDLTSRLSDAASEDIVKMVPTVMPLLKDVATNRAAWKVAFKCRPGALDDLDKQVTIIMQGLVQGVLATQGFDKIGHLECIQIVAECLGLSEVASTAKEARLQQHASTQEQRVKDAVSENLVTIEQVQELLTSFRSVVNSGILFTDSDLRSSFMDARDFLMKFLSTNAVDPSAQLNELQPAFDLADHFLTEKSLQAENPDIAATDKKHLTAIVAIAKSILAIHNAVRLRTALAGNDVAEVKEKLYGILRHHSECSKMVAKHHTVMDGESGGRSHWLQMMCSAWADLNANGSELKTVATADIIMVLQHTIDTIRTKVEDLEPKSKGGTGGEPWHAAWPTKSNDQKIKDYIAKTIDLVDQLGLDAEANALDSAISCDCSYLSPCVGPK
jgi:hypothetical protein